MSRSEDTAHQIQNEAFVEEHGELAFSHTKIILREGDQYYYAITSRRYPTTFEVNLLELNLIPIPANTIRTSS
jgi:hypothetical protein